LCVDTIGVSTTFDNIFGLLLKALVGFGGFGLEELVKKVVNMGCDGNSIFQKHQTNVMLQFKEGVAPFLNGVHCFTHKINLVMGCSHPNTYYTKYNQCLIFHI
jgi:hypothetical protein